MRQTVINCLIKQLINQGEVLANGLLTDAATVILWVYIYIYIHDTHTDTHRRIAERMGEGHRQVDSKGKKGWGSAEVWSKH